MTNEITAAGQLTEVDRPRFTFQQFMKDQWYAKDRLAGLRRFAIAITLLNILGHVWLGFEQAWIHPFAALATTYSIELFLEWMDSLMQGRRPRFTGGLQKFVEFLLPAHISGLAVAMLLYPGDRVMPIVFAAAVAMCSKSVFRVAINGGNRHIYNPSNFGIATTLLLFPWVGIAPPYMFTENLSGYGNWVFPLVIICSGTLLNTLFTKRLPLIATWLSMFALQAVVRAYLFDTTVLADWMPMTGIAFLLFTFYMVTDPPTTPTTARGQIAFGASVAVVYCLLMIGQVVFGLFFSLAIVSTVRGLYLTYRSRVAMTSPAAVSSERIPLSAASTIPVPVQVHAPRGKQAAMGTDQ